MTSKVKEAFGLTVVLLLYILQTIISTYTAYFCKLYKHTSFRSHKLSITGVTVTSQAHVSIMLLLLANVVN